MLRVVFMGTPEFAVPALESIHSSFHIQGVYTQPDRPVGRGLEIRQSSIKAKAIELGLPVFQPDKLSRPGEFEKLRDLSPDVIVVVAYGQILRSDVLELPRLGCINVHSSLLPRWRGAAPIHRAILAGDSETGVTTMHLVPELDAGDVLEQERTPITRTDTAQSVHDRLAQMGAKLILSTLKGLELGLLKRQVQNTSDVTYASKLTKEMEWIDPYLESAVEIDLRVRALNPWPGTSLQLDQRLKIKKATLREDIQGVAGHIFEKAGMLLLGTPQGALELETLQWEGKKELGASEFLNGLRGKVQKLPLVCLVNQKRSSHG
jgi:methionyl-tRNA formyltransferase